jgi:hypothetical protein
VRLWNQSNYIQNPTKNKEDYGKYRNFSRIPQKAKLLLNKIHKIIRFGSRETTEIKNKNCYKSTKEKAKKE